MSKSMIIRGDTKYRCWQCDEETYNISLTFEAPMCSEKCDHEKFKEYLEACGRSSELYSRDDDVGF